jgi:hypothetical protein
MPVAAFDEGRASRELRGAVQAAYTEEHGDFEAAGEGDWREQPVDFDTFVTSREHLNLPPLFRCSARPCSRCSAPTRPASSRRPTPPGRPPASTSWPCCCGARARARTTCARSSSPTWSTCCCACATRRLLRARPGREHRPGQRRLQRRPGQEGVLREVQGAPVPLAVAARNFDVHEAGRRKWAANKGLPKVEINDGDVIFPRGIRCFSRTARTRATRASTSSSG